MTEDEAAELLAQKWGLVRKPPPELLVAVRLRSLLELVATANRAVAVSSGFCLLLGESGRPLLNELDRLQRTLNFQTTELTSILK